MQDGFRLAAPGPDSLVLTVSGAKAAASKKPPSTIDVSSRWASVVMERVTGALIPSEEVQFASRKNLADVWNKTVRLPTTFTDNHLDEGQVQHLLPRKQNEWVRWIGPNRDAVQGHALASSQRGSGQRIGRWAATSVATTTKAYNTQGGDVSGRRTVGNGHHSSVTREVARAPTGRSTKVDQSRQNRHRFGGGHASGQLPFPTMISSSPLPNMNA